MKTFTEYLKEQISEDHDSKLKDQYPHLHKTLHMMHMSGLTHVKDMPDRQKQRASHHVLSHKKSTLSSAESAASKMSDSHKEDFAFGDAGTVNKAVRQHGAGAKHLSDILDSTHHHISSGY